MVEFNSNILLIIIKVTRLVSKHVEQLEPSFIAGRNLNGAATVETVWQFPKILNREIPHNSAIPFLDI